MFLGQRKLQKRGKQQKSWNRVFYPVKQIRKCPLTWDKEESSDLTKGKRKRRVSEREQHMQKLFVGLHRTRRLLWLVWRAMADSAKRMVAVVMAWCKLQTDIPVFLHDIMMDCTLLWVSSVLNTHTKPDSWRANKVWYEYDFTWYTWKNDFCHVRFACHSKSKCYRFNAKERLELYAVSRWAGQLYKN